VAIKVLPAEVAGNPERLARSQREAQLLASLNHPNVAAIHGLEEIGEPWTGRSEPVTLVARRQSHHFSQATIGRVDRGMRMLCGAAGQRVRPIRAGQGSQA
jgi:serine/threonine protein kinase